VFKKSDNYCDIAITQNTGKKVLFENLASNVVNETITHGDYIDLTSSIPENERI